MPSRNTFGKMLHLWHSNFHFWKSQTHCCRNKSWFLYIIKKINRLPKSWLTIENTTCLLSWNSSGSHYVISCGTLVVVTEQYFPENNSIDLISSCFWVFYYVYLISFIFDLILLYLTVILFYCYLFSFVSCRVSLPKNPRSCSKHILTNYTDQNICHITGRDPPL